MELKHTLIIEDKRETEVTSVVLGNLYYRDTSLSHTRKRLLTSTYSTGYHYTSMPIFIDKGDVIRIKTNSASQGIAWLWEDGYKDGKNAYLVDGSYADTIGTWVSYTAQNDNLPVIIMSSANTFSTLEVFIDRLDKELSGTHTIEEPISYDNLQISFERHEYHGIGAEASLGTLEFYSLAADLINKSYNQNIERKILYSVEDSKGIVNLRWLLDLSTYTLQYGKYMSVSCKVCEEGIKTIFNNRTDIDVDIDIDHTIDGKPITKPEWKLLNIPTKHLLYTNKGSTQSDTKYTESGGDNIYKGVIWIGRNYSANLCLPIAKDIAYNEFGTFNEIPLPYSFMDISLLDPQYVASGDFETKFGTNVLANIEIKLNATLEVQGSWLPSDDGTFFKWRLVAVDADGNYLYGEQKKVPKADLGSRGATCDLSCELNGKISASNSIKYYIAFDIDLGNYTDQSFSAHINVHKGSYVRMTMYDNVIERRSNTDLIMVHDAINVVTDVIGEKEVEMRSEWYNYDGTIGGGALKALTNGYKIRNLYTDGNASRNMPISFKRLITSLNAIDCIGWGFSNEDDKLCLRVERWDWFYKPSTILTIDNANEITIEVATDNIITEFTIGYKKYATNDQYNSIDSPHGKRLFSNGNKVVSNHVSKESEFIADNYAIEETRRCRFDKGETEESTYDENIFIFELLKKNADLQILSSAENAKNVGREEEFINAKLTPRHMASRWEDYLFQSNNTSKMKFVSGEINYTSSFEVVPEYYVVTGMGSGSRTTYSLKPFSKTNPQSENQDIEYNPSILKAETIKFKYPLTIAEYKNIKKDPYGLICVNGLYGWIKKFKYSFIDGEAEFTLIAKR